MEIIKNKSKGGGKVSRESKLFLSNFVNGDRFELNSHLNNLFNQFYADERKQSENKMINNRLNQ